MKVIVNPLNPFICPVSAVLVETWRLLSRGKRKHLYKSLHAFTVRYYKLNVYFINNIQKKNTTTYFDLMGLTL